MSKKTLAISALSQLKFPFLTLLLLLCLSFAAKAAPAQEGQSSISACILKKGVYTCDGVTFQKLLANAKTISLETHTIDKVAQSQLTELITKKLGKTVVPEGSPCDLIFLLLPIENEGYNNNAGDDDLGTLRIYLPNSQNTRGELIWAEVFSGRHEMPWPSVVHGVILQFQSHFKIK